ncbi:hypothetical protein H2200_004807 [Cladophialophora chaetospira]|uniref:NmrA-like domain-containing protein n=1 Tax=Cladophialophora chaetospira TaxID=386627 RepID=A0AA38XDS6_9EURO|nr:hypothetical protein H2200_004807 [Cladophialophora chaetospira]
MAQNRYDGGLVVVLGATGVQGGAVLRYFAQESKALSHSFRLRGLTRDPTSDAAQALSRAGVKMVKGDLDDVSSLHQAFEGATHIFANTDSNRIMWDATRHPEYLAQGQSPAEYGAAIEKRHGAKIVEAAAAVPTLRRIVYSGLASPRRWSEGGYSKVAMFDVKEEIADMFRARRELQRKFSVVMVGFYASDAALMPEVYAPEKLLDGHYEVAMHMAGDVPVPIADVETDLGNWVAALFQADPGVVLVGASECLTWQQWLELWGDHNRVMTTYRRASTDEVAPGTEDFMRRLSKSLNSSRRSDLRVEWITPSIRHSFDQWASQSGQHQS